jgi:hypothetical protein
VSEYEYLSEEWEESIRQSHGMLLEYVALFHERCAEFNLPYELTTELTKILFASLVGTSIKPPGQQPQRRR